MLLAGPRPGGIPPPRPRCVIRPGWRHLQDTDGGRRGRRRGACHPQVVLVSGSVRVYGREGSLDARSSPPWRIGNTSCHTGVVALP